MKLGVKNRAGTELPEAIHSRAQRVTGRDPLKHAASLSLLAILVAAQSSCSYIEKRARDAADIVLIAPEWRVVGAKGQLGPWGQLGYYCSMVGPAGYARGYGLLGPHLGAYEHQDCTLFPLLIFVQSRSGAPDPRHKDFFVMGKWLLPYLEPQTDPDATFGGFEEADDWRRLAPRYTQIELALGVWVGVRVGFNPGELVDFVIGWFGLDLYDDDFDPEFAEEPGSEPLPEEPPDAELSSG